MLLPVRGGANSVQSYPFSLQWSQKPLIPSQSVAALESLTQIWVLAADQVQKSQCLWVAIKPPTSAYSLPLLALHHVYLCPQKMNHPLPLLPPPLFPTHKPHYTFAYYNNICLSGPTRHVVALCFCLRAQDESLDLYVVWFVPLSLSWHWTRPCILLRSRVVNLRPVCGSLCLAQSVMALGRVMLGAWSSTLLLQLFMLV